jgi:hypothetical protein
MPSDHRYLTGTRDITYSATAEPAEIAGTTQARWYAYDVMTDKDIMSGYETREAIEAAIAEREANEAITTATFADGSTRVMTVDTRKMLDGLDSEGNLVVTSDDITYALTPCCNASGKGAESSTGVVCRSCYQEVSERFGDTADVATPVIG